MLIIVESPAKAKTITQILAKQKGSNYTVKASVGHIRGISQIKKLEDGTVLEINGIDTNNHFKPVYEVDPAKVDVVRDLKKLAKASKDGILFATDSDREGEAISWHLAEVLGVKDKSLVKRLEFHEITEKAILQAINNPRPLDMFLVTAQQARQVLDKLVGYKLSPVLWQTTGNHRLSAGRVQSPALRLICEREKEIQNFKSQEYWEVQGAFWNRGEVEKLRDLFSPDNLKVAA
jgi:DNA topoisomerase-1